MTDIIKENKPLLNSEPIDEMVQHLPKVKRKTDPIIINAVVNEYIHGKTSIVSILKKHKVSNNSVTSWVKESGNTLRGSSRVCGTNFDIDLINKAINEYLNGKESLDTVAGKIGMSGGNLRHWIIKLGHKPRKIHESRFDENRIKECCYLYVQGMTNKALAEKYNVSKRTIFDWLIKSNMKPKKFNETLGITPEIKTRAVDLYSNDKLNCGEISRILGVSSRSIFDWIKSIKRTQSEIAIIKIAKIGSVNSYGKKGKVQTKYGEIYYDSWYERDRLIQLNSNEDITCIQRCKDRIKYQDQNGIEKSYIPDFFVEYKDGTKIIEEVKPFPLLEKFNNPIKFQCANEFYKDKNIIFKTVSEVIIYGNEKGHPKYKKNGKN